MLSMKTSLETIGEPEENFIIAPPGRRAESFLPHTEIQLLDVVLGDDRTAVTGAATADLVGEVERNVLLRTGSPRAAGRDETGRDAFVFLFVMACEHVEACLD